MAQLDPSIILGAKPMQIESPVNQLAKVLEVQGMQQQRRMGEMQMQDAMIAREKQNRLAALLQGGATPESLMRGGFLKEAQDMQEAQGKAAKNTADVGKTTAETEKIRLQAGREKLGFVAQLLSSVKDQATYDQAKALAQQNGLPVDNMPPQYDPAVIEQAKTQALTVQDQLEQVWKQKGYDLNVQKFGEDKRSNRAREGLTARGQNMTDARAKETNSVMRELGLQEKQLKVDELVSKKEDRQRSKDASRASIQAQIGVIDKALAHPGRELSTGLSGTLDPRNYIPGTKAADFRAVLDQIGGTAFLQAFESLKGGGQITEVEGRKATEAIARLNRAQSDKEFEASLRELKGVMQKGAERMGATPAAPSGGFKILSVE